MLARRRRFGPSQKDRIFFACLPDAENAVRIQKLAGALKHDKGFSGTLILPEHLHVTLFHLGDWNGLPQPIVDLARSAAEQVAVAPFEAGFVRAESFSNSTGVYPFVLTCGPHASAWSTLHQALGAALTRVGLGGATRGEFKPHITLLRDEIRAKPSAIAPLTWTVREFVLVHSLLGKTTHIHLGRWPLEP